MSHRCETELLNGILERVAQYLDVLAGHVFEIEETVSSSISSEGENGDFAIKNLQLLDFLRQSLEDLALMSSAFGNSRLTQIDYNTIEAIGSKMRLKSTRNLLAEEQIKTVNTMGEHVGDVDLF